MDRGGAWGGGGVPGFTHWYLHHVRDSSKLAPRETWTTPWVTSPDSGTLLREDGHGDHSQEYIPRGRAFQYGAYTQLHHTY